MSHPPAPSASEISQPVLLFDELPWYPRADGLHQAVGPRLAGLYPVQLVTQAVAAAVSAVLPGLLPPCTCVLVPLMSGAIVTPALERYCAQTGGAVLLLPLSRHPFVTLALDDQPLLLESCALYERAAVTALRKLPGFVHSWARRRAPRFAFFDINSATGRDALLIRNLVTDWAGTSVEFFFGVAFNETATDPRRSAGARGGAKVLVPDGYSFRLVNQNLRYFSHLAFLQRQERERFALAERVSARYPRMLAYWDSVPPRHQQIHGYAGSTDPVHTRRLFVRYNRRETADGVPAAVSRAWDWDAVRATVRPELVRVDDRVPWIARADSQLDLGRPRRPAARSL